MNKLKKVYFNDSYRQTHNVIDGRKAQFCKPFNAQANRAFDSLCKKVPGYASGRTCIPPEYFIEQYAPYKVGEVLAVAQPLEAVWRYECGRHTGVQSEETLKKLKSVGVELSKSKGWRNKMFAPPELMPHKIEVSSVRVRRLQGVYGEDVRAEGFMQLCDILDATDSKGWWHDGFDLTTYTSAREAYRALYCAIHGKEEWEANPLVWVVDFKPVS